MGNTRKIKHPQTSPPQLTQPPPDCQPLGRFGGLHGDGHESALKTALEDGPINAGERKLLDSLIASMQLDRNIAQQLEMDICQQAI